MRTFIYDRTEEDVIFAKNNQSNAVDLKGSLNASDLNRIETNLIDLNIELKKNGYYSNQTNKNTWVNTEIPTLEYYNNLRNNLNESYKCVNETHIPFKSNNFLNYIEVNNWEYAEKNSFDLIDNMINSYKICGEVLCGE